MTSDVNDVGAAFGIAVLVMFVIGYVATRRGFKCHERGFKRGFNGLPPEEEALTWPIKYLREYHKGWSEGVDKAAEEKRDRKALESLIPKKEPQPPPDGGVYR